MLMAKRIGFYVGLVAVVLISTLFAGCVQSEDKGDLEVSFADTTGSRMLAPEVNLEIVSYTVSGTGPFGSSFEKTTTVSPFEIQFIEEGEWNITVIAYNDAGIRVATGSNAVHVYAGENVSLHIQLLPPEGTGSLLLDVYLDDTVITDPIIE